MMIHSWDLTGSLDLSFKQNQAYQRDKLRIATEGPIIDMYSVPGS